MLEVSTSTEYLEENASSRAPWQGLTTGLLEQVSYGRPLDKCNVKGGNVDGIRHLQPKRKQDVQTTRPQGMLIEPPPTMDTSWPTLLHS